MDFLNPRWGVWAGVGEVLGERYPYLLPAWQRFLRDERARSDRIREVEGTFQGLMSDLGLEG